MSACGWLANDAPPKLADAMATKSLAPPPLLLLPLLLLLLLLAWLLLFPTALQEWEGARARG
jgi:hypothetical protein